MRNSEFLIANKTSKIINELSNLLELVPKKYYFQKNKTFSYAYDLLETIHIINNTESDIPSYIPIVQKNIAMLDFCISFFLDKKYISIKSAQKTIYLLSEISKMTNSWFVNLKKKDYEN